MTSKGMLQLDLGEASNHNDFKATVLARKGVHFFISGRSGRSLIEQRHINVRGRWLGEFCMRWIFKKNVIHINVFFVFVGYKGIKLYIALLKKACEQNQMRWHCPLSGTLLWHSAQG